MGMVGWRVGVLRPDAENVDWTGRGVAPSWSVARRGALDELHLLIAGEGQRLEFRVEVDGLPAVVFPALRDDGSVDLSGLDDVVPVERYESLQ
ncbi:hypothetical protein [Pseudonocardia parietis]|uniref:Uncharacterized protein n=1 Tax=Pseudonocardia parietis TaxID=570936 RepID=A0ABS4VSU5_9PSEU|nr:hypothetical protein [Pseudonocardia parietis]MBP2366866.1 hypothetical protein [Pseudonocardia parietis]